MIAYYEFIHNLFFTQVYIRLIELNGYVIAGRFKERSMREAVNYYLLLSTFAFCCVVNKSLKF